MKKCRYCDEEIQDRAIVCRYCKNYTKLRPIEILFRILSFLVSTAAICGVIVSIYYGSKNFAKVNENIRLTHNAVLFFGTPKNDDVKKRVFIPITNAGNTKAEDVKWSIGLVRSISDEESAGGQSVKDSLRIESGSSGLDLYPHEGQNESIAYLEGDFIPSRQYFLICYLEYRAVDGSSGACTRYYYYQYGEWTSSGLGKNMFGDNLEKQLADVCRTVKQGLK